MLGLGLAWCVGSSWKYFWAAGGLIWAYFCCSWGYCEQASIVPLCGVSQNSFESIVSAVVGYCALLWVLRLDQAIDSLFWQFCTEVQSKLQFGF